MTRHHCRRGRSHTINFDALIFQATERSDTGVALSTPLAWIPNDRDVSMWVACLMTSEQGVGQGEFRISQFTFGPCAVEPRPWANLFDDMITVQLDGALTGAEAEAMHAELIAAARRRFEIVHVCDSELDAVRWAERLWPGERSRKLAAATVAESA
jgi:hypothetical protein